MSERQIISVTDSALEKVIDLRSGEEDADQLALRIEVIGVQGVDYSYDLAFEVLAEADSDDLFGFLRTKPAWSLEIQIDLTSVLTPRWTSQEILRTKCKKFLSKESTPLLRLTAVSLSWSVSKARP